MKDSTLRSLYDVYAAAEQALLDSAGNLARDDVWEAAVEKRTLLEKARLELGAAFSDAVAPLSFPVTFDEFRDAILRNARSWLTEIEERSAARQWRLGWRPWRRSGTVCNGWWRRSTICAWRKRSRWYTRSTDRGGFQPWRPRGGGVLGVRRPPGSSSAGAAGPDRVARGALATVSTSCRPLRPSSRLRGGPATLERIAAAREAGPQASPQGLHCPSA